MAVDATAISTGIKIAKIGISNVPSPKPEKNVSIEKNNTATLTINNSINTPSSYLLQ